MEKPFLPFNDYLGLSNIFKLSQNNEVQQNNIESTNRVTKSVSDAWIDKRIEEILHRYSLKNTLNENQCANRSYFGIRNGASGAGMELSLESATANGTAVLNAGNLPLQYSSPIISNGNSLTSSPLSPNAASWFTSAATSCAVSSFDNGTASRILPPTSCSSLPLPTSNLLQSEANGLDFNTTLDSFTDYARENQQVPANLSLIHLQHRNNFGCSFCRNNKEVNDWVMSHQLKDSLNRVVCPILRSYVCPLCFATGDNAHTLGHCPLNPDKKNSSLPLAVRRRTNATGRLKL